MIFSAGKPDSEQEILARIRSSLGRDKLDAAQAQALETRLVAAQTNLIPAQAQGTADELRLHFIERALISGASVDEAKNADDIPVLVASFLSRSNLPPEIFTSSEEWIDALPWRTTPFLVRHQGPVPLEGAVSLTACFAGIAETGTLMLCSSAASPSLLNFLSETHIVILQARDIVGPLEAGWRRLRTQVWESGAHLPLNLPRTVNLITGPSRTADIEQTMYMGAHGPRRLHIIVVSSQ